MEPGLITVSELASAARCPVRLFMDRSSPWTEPPEYTVCKQISYHLGNGLETAGIWQEICGVAPGINPSVHDYLSACIEQCSSRQWVEASDYDLFLKSEKYGICGTIDRIFENPPYFSIIRSTRPPIAGVYGGDRLRVLGYALCLSELLGEQVCGGNVDYIPGGESRYCEIQPRDMRRFYTARNAVGNINAGVVPKRPANPPCSSCRYKERCDTGPSRLSDRL